MWQSKIWVWDQLKDLDMNYSELFGQVPYITMHPLLIHTHTHTHTHTHKDYQIFLQKDEFSWDQQRIAIWGLQPWQASCKSPQDKRSRNILQRRKASWEGRCKQMFTFVYIGMSLVVQCLRICLPMQGMWSKPKIPQATRQLSPCAITREPMCCNY